MIFLSLGEWWSSLGSTLQIFWGISIIFSVLFVIQFVLSLIGLDFDTDADIDIPSDSPDSGFGLETDFTIFSVRSIIAFFTFFGWAGVLVLRSGGSTGAAIGFACLSGFSAMLLVGYMMYLFSKLTEEGNLDINEALFNTGEVYLKIPANKEGYGKVHLKINGSLRELDAITTEGETLPTGSQVRVIEVLEDNLLLVEPIDELLARN